LEQLVEGLRSPYINFTPLSGFHLPYLYLN